MGGKLGLEYKKDYDGPQYDLVIGNPPYGEFANEFKGMGEGKDHRTFQEYFIDRGLDTLKPGGTMVFIVPSAFLSGGPSPIKEALAKKGTLVEAYRLPNGAFPTTDVGTDIIVLRKEPGDPEQLAFGRYFRQNPGRVLGTEKLGPGRFGPQMRTEGDPRKAVASIKPRQPVSAEAREKISQALMGNMNAAGARAAELEAIASTYGLKPGEAWREKPNEKANYFRSQREKLAGVWARCFRPCDAKQPGLPSRSTVSRRPGYGSSRKAVQI